RVRERRPRQPERRQQQQRRRGDPDADRVVADLRLPLERRDEEAVDEVDSPDRELSGDERHPEPVHGAEEPSVELEPQLVTAIAKEHEIDRERPDPVADDHPHRPLVEVDDQKEATADRDWEVRNSRDGAQKMTLYDA